MRFKSKSKTRIMSKHWYNILIINFLSIIAVAKEPISLEAALSKSLLKAEVTKHPSEDETRHRNLRGRRQAPAAASRRGGQMIRARPAAGR